MIIRKSFMLTNLLAALLLAGCGGSDSNAVGDTTSSNALISGTVVDCRNTIF